MTGANMEDKFTKYYIVFTIIYAVLGLLQIVGYYLDNIILKNIIILASYLDIVWLIVSIIYLVHVIKRKFDSKYRILPISYIIYFIVFFIIGIVIAVMGIMKSGNVLYFLETDSSFIQTIWILGGCYNLFQLGYSYYLLQESRDFL